MKTFKNKLPVDIGEFTYEGCKYSGIKTGQSFSVLSEGLANYLLETFDCLEELLNPEITTENEYCCSKCGKDCGSKYMKERHEKVCKEEPKDLCPILKPIYIFWNYKNLDKTQLTPDQYIPELPNSEQLQPKPEFTEEEISEPAPGVKGTSMIGKTMQNVVTDRDGIEWYGNGLEDDIA